MALQKCTECSREISTTAFACPGCGAPRVHLATKSTSLSTWLTLVVFGGLLLLLVRACTSGDDTPATRKPAPPPVVDYSLALETERGALVCPLAVLFDQRERRGIQAAMASRLSVFHRLEEAEAAGCTEWREGISVQLSKEEADRAVKAQQERMCRMLEFSDGLVFSCALRNPRNLVANVAASPSAPPLVVPPRTEWPLPPPVTQELKEIAEPPSLVTVIPPAAASSEAAASESKSELAAP